MGLPEKPGGGNKPQPYIPSGYGDESGEYTNKTSPKSVKRNEKPQPNCHIKNSIIMQDGQVQEGAYIENCILDKQAVIKRNSKLIGPEAYPIVIAKNVVI